MYETGILNSRQRQVLQGYEGFRFNVYYYRHNKAIFITLHVLEYLLLAKTNTI